jgi:hypothetical protein
VVEAAEFTTLVPPIPPAPAPKPAGKLLSDATAEDIRVEAVRRRLGLNGNKPHQPAELGDLVGQVAGALGGRVPPIKLHADGSMTGPATVPSANGHAHPNGKKGGR